MTPTKQEYETLKRLRSDALDRGMHELAIAYGWSAIRVGEEILGREMTQLEIYKLAR